MSVKKYAVIAVFQRFFFIELPSRQYGVHCKVVASAICGNKLSDNQVLRSVILFQNADVSWRKN